jgi:DinB superfamily
MATPSDQPEQPHQAPLPARPVAPPALVPDDKNWTWVLERACPDCGFDAAVTPASSVPGLIEGQVAEWRELLTHPHARLRPSADQWSALEYACHVRDVFRLFDLRLELMLAEDGPRFANWDQDVTAVEDRYDLQDPAVVADELAEAAAAISTRFRTVTDDQWDRTGLRSDGAEFTVDTFARYFIHDPLHHLDDVRRGNQILADGDLD